MPPADWVMPAKSIAFSTKVAAMIIEDTDQISGV